MEKRSKNSLAKKALAALVLVSSLPAAAQAGTGGILLGNKCGGTGSGQACGAAQNARSYRAGCGAARVNPQEVPQKNQQQRSGCGAAQPQQWNGCGAYSNQNSWRQPAPQRYGCGAVDAPSSAGAQDYNNPNMNPNMKPNGKNPNMNPDMNPAGDAAAPDAGNLSQRDRFTQRIVYRQGQ